MSRKLFDVAVVGAGLSGLAAARRLEQRGLSVCVIEARERIGGRVTTLAALGAPYDAGGQFLHPNCHEMLALAARHGIETVLAATDGAVVRSFDGDRVIIDSPAAMFGDEAATQSVFGAIGELQTMMAELPDAAPWAAPRAGEWDAVTFRSWAAARCTDPLALALFVMRPTFDMALGWDNISLLAVLAHMKAGGVEKAMGVIVKVKGGTAALVAALATELKAKIVLASPVRAIAYGAEGVKIESESGPVDARAAIVALSPTLADRIAFSPPLPRARVLLQRGWRDAPSIKTLAVYDRPWWIEEGLAGTALGDLDAAPVVMDASAPGQTEGVLVVFSHCGAHAYDHAAVLKALIHYFGEKAAAPRTMISHDWFGEHWTSGCGSAPPPGLLSSYGPALRAPVGPIFWAGTETAIVGTYNMEGAVTAGQRAADEAADALSGIVEMAS